MMIMVLYHGSPKPWSVGKRKALGIFLSSFRDIISNSSVTNNAVKIRSRYPGSNITVTGYIAIAQIFVVDEISQLITS